MATASLSGRLAAGPVAREPVVLRMMPSDVVLSLPGGATECQGSLNQDWGTATRDGEPPTQPEGAFLWFESARLVLQH